MSDKGNKGAKGKGKGTPSQDKKPNSPPVESKQEKPVEKKAAEKKEDVAPENRQQEGNASTPTSARKTAGGNNEGSAEQKKESRVQQVRLSGSGVVKAVLSGDTIVVINLAKNQLAGPPTDKIISLSNISAPSLARKKSEKGDKTSGDKPFAWDSREFLRKKLIGKPVTYVIEAKATNKEYGAVFLDSENVAYSVVKNGWATVRRPARSEGPVYEALKDMIQAEDEARQAGKGIFDKSKDGFVRPTTQEPNPTELFAKLKGQPQTAIVEQVKNGNTLRLTLLPSFTEITLIISGVDCPSSNPNHPDPFGREAKFFTEHHLLNREVSVILEGADKWNFYGTVSYANRYISEELLRQGLGKYVDWSGMRTAFHDRLKAAEHEAKEKKLRIWASYVPPKPLSRQEEKKVAKPGREVTGIVIEVANSCCITIQDPSGVDHKIYLSSVRGPRDPENPSREQTLLTQQVTWEGKEYLRKKLIGNRVRCVLDYTKEGPPKSQGKDKGKEKAEERNYCSVYLDKNNIAVELVEQGFVEPSEHRGGEQRSRDYEHIIFAESRAKKLAKGIHAKPESASAAHIVEISEAKQAKQKFPALQRHGKMRGVIEYEFSPSRFKVYVPKENCQIVLSLGGVQTPTRDDECFKPALHFVKTKIHQHDVDFEVQAQDTRGSGFIGNVWVNKQSLSSLLLEEGFAKIYRGADRDTEMVIAESIAKKKKRGLWKDYDEAAEENQRKQQQQEREQKKPKQEFVDVIVTEIVDGTTIWVQIVGPDAEQLEELMKQLAADDTPGEYAPKEKEIVKAQFTADDTWYRAKVLKVLDNNEYQVQYVDYGNSEVIPASRIRKLPAELNKLPHQATEAVLAFLKTNSIEDEFGREAVEFLRELVWGKTMMANVERKERLADGTHRLHLSLGDRESQVLVNAALLRAGLARVDQIRGEQYKEMLEKLREEESKARQSHLGIWEYGDPFDEDDEERRGKPKGKRT
jgi:staphylococcal nuclease domain-containing protein 1